MAVEIRTFRRLVVGLDLRASAGAVQVATALAELLKLELLGVFIEDTSLHNLAGMPFARELRPLGGEWHRLDTGELSRHLERAARTAERLFGEAAKRLSTQWRFEVVRGPLAGTIAAVSQTGDIVVIGEPASAAERASQQFSWLLDAALQSAAAVLVVPSRIARRQGPVVAVAAAPDDVSLVVAADIAAATNEDLVVVDRCATALEEERVGALPRAKDRRVEHIVAGPGAADAPASLSHVLHSVRERLIVMTRRAFDGRAVAAIAAARQVPVLVVEPG
jgi:molybdopterin-guanine dinucleotide biosynthesis protein A